VYKTDGTVTGTVALPASGGNGKFAIADDGAAYVVGGGAGMVAYRIDPLTLATTSASVAPTAVTVRTVAAIGNSAAMCIDPSGSSEVWVTNGTSDGGTRKLGNLLCNVIGAIGNTIVVGGYSAFYTAPSADGGLALLRNGLSLSSANSDLQLMAPCGTNQLCFAGDDGVNGRELWMTDGTLAGTYQLMNLAPGPASSNPAWMVRVGSKLFFTATDGITGTELWVIDLP
jgi:ELWxxDGT repeat protein